MLQKSLFALFVLTMVLGLIGRSQTNTQLPNLVPPSPDAAALGKYGEIPVDKSTGVPQISIPLYEIKTPRFNLPISLSYHASGIKVEEISSWVGAGWSLNAGGVVTRSIVGLADDDMWGFLLSTVKSASDIQWPADINYISAVLNQKLDTDPDNFFYNFAGNSGAFVFGDDKKPVLIPYQPIKINFDLPSKTFTITDGSGNSYYFNTPEYVTSSISYHMSGISSWYLSQMVSADKSDTINFDYTTDVSQQIEYSYNFSQDIGDYPDYVNKLRSVNTSSSWRTYNAVRLSRIRFNGGKVDFIAKSGRLDDGVMSLDSIVVYNQNLGTNQYNKLESFKLLTDYFYDNSLPPANYPIFHLKRINTD